jgi:purine-binding chemotaxis protein CheW
MKTILAQKVTEESIKSKTRQFATFIVDGRIYGIDVRKVQEVTRPLQVTLMRSAPPCVKGLINLRGQIATAVGLRDLFSLSADDGSEKMTVVCKVEDVLLSLLVDKIGDVIEVTESNFEPSPQTISATIRTFMQGVYKTENSIISIISLENILQELDKKCA